jgi:hypothetical protein
MDKKLHLIIIVFLVISFSLSMQAQESVLPTGGNSSGTGGSVSYSVGQTSYTTDSGSGMSVAKGLQQPYEISVVTASGNLQQVQLEWSVFPNPVTDYLILRINESVIRQYETVLFDQSGKEIGTKIVTSGESRIFMKELVTGTYFLRVTHKAERGKAVHLNGRSGLSIDSKTFKIIKF